MGINISAQRRAIFCYYYAILASTSKPPPPGDIISLSSSSSVANSVASGDHVPVSLCSFSPFSQVQIRRQSSMAVFISFPDFPLILMGSIFRPGPRRQRKKTFLERRRTKPVIPIHVSRKWLDHLGGVYLGSSRLRLCCRPFFILSRSRRSKLLQPWDPSGYRLKFVVSPVRTYFLAASWIMLISWLPWWRLAHPYHFIWFRDC
jgi:hypothetical protein